MSFASPWLLVLLAVVPLAVVGYWTMQRRASRYAVSFPNLPVLASVVERKRSWARHLPAALLLGSLAALTVGVARPNWQVLEPSERAAVILLVDVSGSMRATDVRPTRLNAAQRAMQTFADQVPDSLRVGLVAFSDEPQVVVSPTNDRNVLRQGIDILQRGRGTAIGDGLQRAVELAKSTTADPAPSEEGGGGTTDPPAGAGSSSGGQDGATGPDGPVVDAEGRPLVSILLLSDGAQTRGNLTPGQGADLAKQAGIAIYTIALGTDEGMIMGGPPGQERLMPVPPDRETLSAIAEYTGGTAYEAETAESLEDVYKQLGSKVGREAARREISSLFAALGAALAAAGFGVGILRTPRLP